MNGHAVGARGDDTLVQIMPGDPLPDHTPAIDDSAAALASPYAAEF